MTFSGKLLNDSFEHQEFQIYMQYWEPALVLWHNIYLSYKTVVLRANSALIVG
jgi:hypothetical protein